VRFWGGCVGRVQLQFLGGMEDGMAAYWEDRWRTEALPMLAALQQIAALQPVDTGATAIAVAAVAAQTARVNALK